MKTIRTLVVDDEPLARSRIINLLKDLPYISLIGECKNGRETIESIKKYRPDLVFLDIQMPDYSGFEVLNKAGLQPLPFVIFVTAYDQYALRAFDVHAVDYLLKPYDDERFLKALNYAKQHIQLKENTLIHQKMLRVLQSFDQRDNEYTDTLEIKAKGKNNYINTNDIFWIEAQGNYLKINLEQSSYLIRQTLQEIENKLDNNFFIRIHRSLLVNTLHLEKIKYQGNNQYIFSLKNERKMVSGRSYKDAIQNYIETEELRKRIKNE